MSNLPSSATFRRDIDALPELVSFVGDFFAAEGIDPKFRFTIDFALEELFTNCIKYNAGGKCGIDVELAVENDRLRVALTDSDSDAFDIQTDAPAVRVDQPLQERKPGGLGVHLVKNMMDRVEYAHEHRVSIITLFKNLR